MGRSAAANVKLWAIYALFTVFVSSATFYNMGFHSFTFDDEDYVKNARLAQSDPKYIFSPSFSKPWASRLGVHTLFYFLYKSFKEDAKSYHLFNVFVHTVNALVFAYLVSVFFNHPRSGLPARSYPCGTQMGLLSGFLFLLNCSHYRATYWISAVSILLGTTFVLTSFIFAQYYVSQKKTGWIVLSGISFLVSMFMHQSMGIAIVPLFAYLFWIGKLRGIRFFKSVLPFILSAVVFWSVDRFVYNSPFSSNETYEMGLHVLQNYSSYLFWLLTEAHWILIELKSSLYWVWKLGYVLLGVSIFFLWKAKPKVSFWIVWILVCVFPYALWNRGYNVPRYNYLPALGSSVLLSFLLLWMWNRERVSLKALTAVLVVLIGVSSFSRLKTLEGVQYRDSGKYFLVKEDYKKAIEHLSKGINIYPRQDKKVYLFLANAYMEENRSDDAERVLKDLLEWDPENEQGRHYLNKVYLSKSAYR